MDEPVPSSVPQDGASVGIAEVAEIAEVADVDEPDVESPEPLETSDVPEAAEASETSLSGGRRVRARLARLATPRTSKIILRPNWICLGASAEKIWPVVDCPIEVFGLSKLV